MFPTDIGYGLTDLNQVARHRCKSTVATLRFETEFRTVSLNEQRRHFFYRNYESKIQLHYLATIDPVFQWIKKEYINYKIKELLHSKNRCFQKLSNQKTKQKLHVDLHVYVIYPNNKKPKLKIDHRTQLYQILGFITDNDIERYILSQTKQNKRVSFNVKLVTNPTANDDLFATQLIASVPNTQPITMVC